MPDAAGGTGAAHDAMVATDAQASDQVSDQVQAYREQLADEADAAVAVIEDKLAGLKQALADKKAEAKQLRTDANKGGEG